MNTGMLTNFHYQEENPKEIPPPSSRTQPIVLPKAPKPIASAALLIAGIAATIFGAVIANSIILGIGVTIALGGVSLGIHEVCRYFQCLNE